MKGDGKRCVLGTAHDKIVNIVNRITNCPLQQATCKGHPIKALRRTLREVNKVRAGRRFPYLASLHQADACCSLSNDSLQRFAIHQKTPTTILWVPDYEQAQESNMQTPCSKVEAKASSGSHRSMSYSPAKPSPAQNDSLLVKERVAEV